MQTSIYDRESESMEPRAAEPDGGPEEAAVEEARVTDSPTRVSDSFERSSNSRPASGGGGGRGGAEQQSRARLQGLRAPQTAAFGTLPACTTSTGVDTGAMSQTRKDQAAWVPFAEPISARTATDAMTIAVVAVTTEQSGCLSSTGVGTALQTSVNTMTMELHLPGQRETRLSQSQWKTTPQS